MDIQEVVGQFIKSVAEEPSHLKDFGVDPAAAIKNATGIDLSENELSDVVSAIEPMIEGKELDMEKAMQAATEIFGDGDILSKLGDLFGGK